ncbi:hypothetical protein Bca101_007080 [Brassica carinata]
MRIQKRTQRRTFLRPDRSKYSEWRCDFSGFWRHVKNWGELIGFGHAPPSCKENPVSLPIEDLGHHRLFLEQVTETTSGILDFWLQWKEYKEMMELMVESNLSSASMVLMVKAPPPSRCRPPPDPPPSKLLSVAFETLTSIIPPEPPDPPDSFFVLVHHLAINSIGSAASPRPPYLSNKPCEGIVYVPLWNKSMRSSLPLYEDDELPVSTLLPRYEDVLRTSIMLALFHHGPPLWSLGLMSMSLSPFPLWLMGKKNLLVGLSGVVTEDIVLKMTLMSLLCEIVWNCQDAKDVSLALVGSSLMVGALMLCPVLLKAKELSLLRFHIFSDSQVFISTLSLGSVLNEIAGVLHDGCFFGKD